MHCEALNVFDQPGEWLGADVIAVGEAGSQVHTVDVVVGVRLDADVADLVPALVILQSQSEYIKIADQVSTADVHIVGVDAAGDLGVFPFVQPQRVQVSVTD